MLVCHGVAGTGKTTVLTAIAKEFPTRSSVRSLARRRPCCVPRAGLKACTVHSLFYKLVDKGIDEKTKKRILILPRVHAEGAMRGKVILLDECSMIDRKTANDLLQSGALIIAVGDPGQLPPVHGAAFFNEADITLRTIHRQALELGGAAAGSRDAREWRVSAGWRDFQVVRKATEEQMMAADTILCWRNATRHKINKQMRRLLGFNLPYPMQGEKVLCLKNSHQHGIFNGVTYELASNFQPDDDAIHLLIDGDEVEVPNCVFVEKAARLMTMMTMSLSARSTTASA